MGRPLKNIFFGGTEAGQDNPGIQLSIASAFIPGAPAISSTPIVIIRQVGTGRYQVTDGTYIGVVRLVGTATANPGDANLVVTPYGGGPTELARVVLDRTVKTWSDNVYDWSINAATQVGQANLPFV